MTRLSDRFSNSALKLIQRYGVEVTLIRKLATYNTINSSIINSSRFGSCSSVVFTTLYDSKEIDGETIRATDLRMYSDSTQEVSVGDNVIIDEKWYRVLDVKKVLVNGINVFTQSQLRT